MRIKLIALSLFVCAFAFAQTPPSATKPAPPPHPCDGDRSGITPDFLWQALVAGNQHYVKGKIVYDDLIKEREVFAARQCPPMTILSCSDSRVPPEIAFNQSINGLFIVRTAGNYADTLGLASIEFAIANNWTKLIVVLAHEDCGAIKGALAIGDPSSPNLLALVTRIRESFYGIEWKPNDDEWVKKATIANAQHAAAALLAQSPMIRQAVSENRVKIVVAYYSTTTGEVTRVD